ncbi:MAG: HsdM family class I SAM-dependent methyltransferase [Candidatus Binatia bacterium]
MAKGQKGQYFTPRHVIDCCVQMIAPGPAETVLDPACGSGGFLIHTLNYVRRNHDLDVQAYCQTQVWGTDFDHRAIRVAKALMLIAGDGHANLFRLNSLLTPTSNLTLFSTNSEDDGAPRFTIEDVARSKLRGFKGFDIVVTNPPFAGEVRESHILRAYDLARNGRRIERDVLFLERCIDLLRPGGRIAIVLPHNKLGSTHWSYVREWLVRHLRVVAVLGLGRNTFLPHTHQKASVLFGIKRERAVRRPDNEEVLFLVSERDGKDSKGQTVSRAGVTLDDPQWIRADHDLADVVTLFRDFMSTSDIAWGA